MYRISKWSFRTPGLGTESLEQLDVPIGKNRPSPTEARDILRARAGQQALDRALGTCGVGLSDRGVTTVVVTGSFQIADRVQSPAL